MEKMSERYENTVKKITKDGMNFGIDLAPFFNMDIKKEIEENEKELDKSIDIEI